jgi:hypothetical protein
MDMVPVVKNIFRKKRRIVLFAVVFFGCVGGVRATQDDRKNDEPLPV